MNETWSRRDLLRTTAVGAVAAPFAARPARAAVFPGTTWPTGTPASQRLNVAKLLEAQAFATRWGGAGCVIRNGVLVHLWGNLTTRWPINSATKSWGAVMLGIAMRDGRVRLSDRVQSRLPNFGQNPVSNVATGWLPGITFEQLATHTAGFDRPSGYARLIARPGTRFIYSDCGCNWLGAALTHVWRQDLRVVSQQRLFGPMGLDAGDIVWRTPPSFFKDPVYGIRMTELNGGISANVDAMARLGYLMLHRGAWNGVPILTPEYVAQSTGPYFARMPFATTLRGHGLLWWNNAAGWMPGVPRDCFYALGKNDNLTIVIPSLQLVVVRVGTDGWRNHGGKLDSFLNPIVQAVIP